MAYLVGSIYHMYVPRRHACYCVSVSKLLDGERSTMVPLSDIADHSRFGRYYNPYSKLLISGIIKYGGITNITNARITHSYVEQSTALKHNSMFRKETRARPGLRGARQDKTRQESPSQSHWCTLFF